MNEQTKPNGSHLKLQQGPRKVSAKIVRVDKTNLQEETVDYDVMMKSLTRYYVDATLLLPILTDGQSVQTPSFYYKLQPRS